VFIFYNYHEKRPFFFVGIIDSLELFTLIRIVLLSNMMPCKIAFCNREKRLAATLETLETVIYFLWIIA